MKKIAKKKQDINEDLQVMTEFEIDFTFLRLNDMTELYRRLYKKWKNTTASNSEEIICQD